MSLPWLEPAMATLRSAHAADRLPHGLLLHGSRGIGADAFALWVAQLALCTARDGAPCQRCPSCTRVAAIQHPDLHWIAPVEESKQIRVEQVRELCAELTLTSHSQGYKVAVLTPADSLNANAANALLKTLEEPPARTMLILAASQPSRLPATIRSRCQTLRLPLPDRAATLAYLQSRKPDPAWAATLDVVGNLPVLAAELDPGAIAQIDADTRSVLADVGAGRADVPSLADRWARTDLDIRVRSIENWITNRVREQVPGASQSVELRRATHLSERGSDLNIRRLFELLDATRELAAVLDTPLNKTLALENLLWRFSAASSRHRQNARRDGDR